MKKIVFILVSSLILSGSCSPTKYTREPDGIILRLNKKNDGGISLLRVQLINANIARVSATAGNSFSTDTSLVVLTGIPLYTDWNLMDTEDTLHLNTPAMDVRIVKETGELIFCDRDGNIKLREIPGGGKSLMKLPGTGPEYYSISQVFDSPGNEALYGLGQYQNAEMNIKGSNVDIAQHNIVSVVPFLVSSRQYGLLWDNYSRTRFGDPREYKQLSGLNTFGKDGITVGLDAEYSLREAPFTVIENRKEKIIDAKFLPNLDKFPENFPLGKGKVTWEGYLVSDFTAEHRFELFASGYIKMWINGELVADFWRQSWNPWFKKINTMFDAGEKNSIRIEWMPDSDQPYISLTWLEVPEPGDLNKIRFSSESGKQLEYYFVNGESMDDVISGYRFISGKSPLMPRWAMGLWQSRQRYKTQEEILSVVGEFRARKIPLDNIVLDWFYWPENKWGDHQFDAARFPDPAGMVKTLHEKLNTHFMISVWPKFYTETENYRKMNEKGWLYKANVEDNQKDWVGYVSTFYDAFNPDARKFYWEGIRDSLLSKGIDGWWMDATEPDIFSNVSFDARKRLMSPTCLGTATNYFNAYSLVHSSGVYAGLRKDDPDRRVFILTRSAFAGQQRYAAATWSGDVASTWEDLENQIPAGLNFSLSGIPFWTTDIGGFSVERRYENPSPADAEEWKELMTRWFQFGTFCPLLRVHGEYPYREMFNVAAEGSPSFNSMLYYDKLRYRLLPYIYTLDAMTYFEDYTIMRALVMDFGNDQKTENIGDEFMFGPSILAAPVYKFKQREREVYLPSGCNWFDLYSGEPFEGGQSVVAKAPLSKIPLFAREGSILLLGPDLQYASEKPADPVDVIIFTGKDAKFLLYEDEGTNYNYEKNYLATIEFFYNEKEKTLSIGDRSGEFPGMLMKRTFNVAFVSREMPGGIETIKKFQSISYDGNRVTVNFKTTGK